MRKTSKDSTLDEIIERIGYQEKEYMISPMQDINYGFIPDENVKKQIGKIIQGRKFNQLKLEEITKIFTAWNLPSMIDGLDYLIQKAEVNDIFYDIWDQTENGKTETGLTAFPVTDKAKFVVICPGGGYENVCSIAEGFPLAMEMNRLGYAAFILQYRTGKDAKYPGPLEDLAQAVRFILEHAEEFNIDSAGYAVLGFSAGGHLAASFGTKNLGYERYGLPKPEMMILGYPVITMGDKAHEGSRKALLGMEHVNDQRLRDQYSIEKQVNTSYPPVYLWQCEADETVPVENSKMLAEALGQNDVPYFYEIFPGKEHGWGLGTGTHADGWVERMVRFWRKTESKEEKKC